MNDRYLFRAKRMDNGEWVEGLLTIMCGQFHIINPDDENTAYPIDESTICQCTGLKDKNDKLIWENDILKYKWDGETRIDVIEYEAPIFTYSKSMRWSLHKDEVIGNIFDNPELLEVGE